MAKTNLTAARLRELLYYNARTGEFTWAKKSGDRSRSCAGFRADSIDTGTGYGRIGIDGTRYLAHRLAWLYATDAWPDGEIDHVNGVRSDNRWCNIRVVNRAENRQNLTRAQAGNVSGFLGVSPSKKRWAATIRVSGKKIFIGRFSSPEDAHAAYVEAKRELHNTCTI